MIRPSPPSNSLKAASTATNPNLVSAKTWHRFFTQFTGITSAISLALALVFFIAYNWLYMGKMAKFGLVETALILSIVAYAVLAHKGLFKLGQQLLLLIASIITGSLLALVGQVYQTGADSWQLFFSWAALIMVWVVIARLPALWLLWLGLINVSFMLYHNATGFGFITAAYSDLLYLILLTAINGLALILALKFTDKFSNKVIPYWPASSIAATTPKVKTPVKAVIFRLNWSIYTVAALVIYFATRLGLYPLLNISPLLPTILAFGAWLAVMAFFYQRFRKKQIDLLMLTLVSGSVILILMVIATQYIAPYLGDLALFALAFILIALSASAVNWLRNLNTGLTNTGLKQQSVRNDNCDDFEQLKGFEALENTAAIQAPSIPSNSPWYLQLFLGLTGLLSGALITGFLVVILNTALRDIPIKLILSVLLFFISFVLYHPHLFKRSTATTTLDNADKSHTFGSSLAFALSLSAQAFLAAVLFQFFEAPVLIVSGFMLLQVLLFVLIQDRLPRFISAFIALGCLVWLLSYYQLPELSAALLALSATVTGLPIAKLPSSKNPQRLNFSQNHFTQHLCGPSLLKPLNYASTLMLLLVSVVFIAAEYTQHIVGIATEFGYRYSLAQTLVIAVCLYAAHLILSHYQLKLTSKTGRLVGLSIICLGMVSLYVPGVLTTSLVIIMVVANQNKTLFGLSIAALVGYIFWYYYQLDSSLLVKSGSLIAVALVLFAIRELLNREHFVQSSLLRLYSDPTANDKGNDNHNEDTKEEELS